MVTEKLTEDNVETQKKDRLTKGIVTGIVGTFIGLAGAAHFDSIVAGIICGGIVFALVYIEARFINPL